MYIYIYAPGLTIRGPVGLTGEEAAITVTSDVSLFTSVRAQELLDTAKETEDAEPKHTPYIQSQE